MEQPKRLEAAVPPPVPATVPAATPTPVPPPAAHEDHIPEAPQLPAQEDPQGTRETLPTYADAARTPPSPGPQGAAPQPAAGETRSAGSPLCRSTRASRLPRRYIEEF